MNREAEEWVYGLRYTMIARGRSYLHTSDGDSAEFCCLGLACEWSGLGHWDYENTQPGAYHYAVPGYIVKPLNILPLAVQVQLGLRTSIGAFHVTGDWLAMFHHDYPETALKFNDYLAELGNGEPSLANLNDWLNAIGEPGLTFEDIANVIESEPPGLFDA